MRWIIKDIRKRDALHVLGVTDEEIDHALRKHFTTDSENFNTVIIESTSGTFKFDIKDIREMPEYEFGKWVPYHEGDQVPNGWYLATLTTTNILEENKVYEENKEVCTTDIISRSDHSFGILNGDHKSDVMMLIHHRGKWYSPIAVPDNVKVIALMPIPTPMDPKKYNLLNEDTCEYAFNDQEESIVSHE